jgi:hypothetical protein
MQSRSVPSLPESTTCDLVQAWLATNGGRLGREISPLRRTAEPSKLHAGYETTTLLVSVTAWDDGRCLDIDVMDKATKQGRIVASGPCSDGAALLSRLEDFAQILDAQQNASNNRWKGP